MTTLDPGLKFGGGSEVGDSHCYGNVYRQEIRGGQPRLLVGPSARHVEVTVALAEKLKEPLKLLYVLVVPRGSNDEDAGRYESPPLDRAEVKAFFREYGDFFEKDGRHTIWVGSPGSGQIIYDRHNVVYAYGSIGGYESVLKAWGMTEGAVTIPSPHWHAYHHEFDFAQKELLSRWDWRKTTLREGDDA